MKRFVIVLVLFLLLATSASALDTISITSGWHEFIETIDYSGESFYVYGSANTVNANDDEGSIFIKHNSNKTYLVGFGKCEDEGLYEFCFTNKSIENSKITPGPGISLLPALEYSIKKIDISSQIEITKTVSNNKPHLNDIIEGTTVIENTGSSTLTSVAYEDVLPKGFVFVNYHNDLLLVGDRLTATIYQLGAGRKETFTYSMKPRKRYTDIDQRSVSRVKYSVQGVDEIIDEVAYEQFNVVDPFTQTASLSASKVARTDDVIYSFSLKNNEEKEISLSDFKITFPDGLDVKSHENLTRNGDVFSYDDYIDAGDTLTFDIKIDTPYTGDYIILYEGIVYFDDFSFDIGGENSLIVSSQGLSCTLKCTNTVVYFGEEQICDLTLYNKDDTPYYNIAGVLSSPDETVDIDLESIGSGRTRDIYSLIVDTDNLAEKTRYEISFNATYKSSRGELFSCDAHSYFTMKSKSSSGLLGGSSSEEIVETPSKQEVKKMTFIQRIKYILSSIF